VIEYIFGNLRESGLNVQGRLGEGPIESRGRVSAFTMFDCYVVQDFQVIQIIGCRCGDISAGPGKS